MFQSLKDGLIKKWGLSESAADLLAERPELLERLSLARKLPQLLLTPGITPQKIEYLMDDLPYICMENGQVTYYRELDTGLKPLFWEIDIDDEIAVFVIDGEYVVNRLAEAANKIVPQLVTT